MKLTAGSVKEYVNSPSVFHVREHDSERSGPEQRMTKITKKITPKLLPEVTRKASSYQKLTLKLLAKVIRKASSFQKLLSPSLASIAITCAFTNDTLHSW